MIKEKKKLIKRIYESPGNFHLNIELLERNFV